MIRQALALFALQRTLTLHSWTHGKTLAAFFGGALFLLGCVAASGVSYVLWRLGAEFSQERPSLMVLAALDALVLAFVFITLWGLLIDLQRNDLLDLRKLLFLPLPPGLVFGINFLYSMLGPALLFFAPGSVALAAGLAQAHGSHAWGIVPLAVLFFLMVSAWTYHARGWMAILLQDRRRRRVFVVAIPIIAILLSQVPAFATFYLEDSGLRWSDLAENPVWASRLHTANLVFPPLWLALGAHAVLAMNFERAAWCGIGMALVMLMGLAIGYRTTVKYYRAGGAMGGPAIKARQSRWRPLTARALPVFSSDTGAMAAAFFLDFARHPAVRSQLIMPPLMTVLLCAGFLMRRGDAVFDWGAGATPLFVLLLPFLGSTMMFFNLFGTDVRGFRGLVLLPAARHRILLAKNLALFPFVAVQCLMVMGIATVMTGAPASAFALQLLHVPASYALFCVLGNFLSVYAPSPLSRDALRATGGRLLLMVRGMGYALLAGLALAPSMTLLSLSASAQWAGSAQPSFVWWSSAALALGALVLYRMLLVYAGDLLTAREQAILVTLTRETT